jgi:hypothetical protein
VKGVDDVVHSCVLVTFDIGSAGVLKPSGVHFVLVLPLQAKVSHRMTILQHLVSEVVLIG